MVLPVETAVEGSVWMPKMPPNTPKIRLNSIPTFHLYFTISNMLYICMMNMDGCSFHPPVCFLPLLEGTASMEISGGDDLGKRSRARWKCEGKCGDEG
jgi:hypothetical protein